RDRLLLVHAFLILRRQGAEGAAGAVEQRLPADRVGPAFERAAFDTRGFVIVKLISNAAPVEPGARLLHRVAILDAVDGDVFCHGDAPHPCPLPAGGEREISRPHALAATRAEFDGPIGNGDAEGRADGALDEPDLAAVRSHQLSRDREAETGAARAGR